MMMMMMVVMVVKMMVKMMVMMVVMMRMTLWMMLRMLMKDDDAAGLLRHACQPKHRPDGQVSRHSPSTWAWR